MLMANNEIRDLFRFAEIRKESGLDEVETLDEVEISDLDKTALFEDLKMSAARYKIFFGSIDDTSYLAWTDNVSNVDFYYSLGMITLEITFKNNEKIEVTLDELYNQNKMRMTMEEKFQVTPPILFPAEYEMAVYLIISRAFRE